jgi:putative salt-induced outer membrane protein YdiY
MQKYIITITAFAFMFCVHSKADQVTVENGDRVSGNIVKSDRNSMTMKTEFFGEVTIPWDSIREIISDQELFVTAANGQVLVGTVSTTGSRLQVRISQADTVPVEMAVVETLRSQAEQDAYEAEIERLRDPGLLDFWSGYIDGGFSFSGGNADTSAIVTSMRTRRTTQRDRISIYATTLFAQNSNSGVTETTANAIRGGTRYEVTVSDRLFTFGFLDLEFDEFQDLDLRSVLGGGLGWHVQDTDRTVFNVFSGGSFNQEFFTNETRRSGELVLGQELTYRLVESTNLSERFSFFPNLSNTGEYRHQFDATLTTDIAKWLAWHFTISNRFLSNPIPGVKKNDVLVTTGVRFSFGEGLR